jgi:hypothetical protein
MSTQLSSRWRRALPLALLAYGIWCLATADRWHFPDFINLPIHETGHLVFAWGGEVITALGGTLFQLIVPLAFVIYFWQRHDRYSASAPLWWMGQNCLNIARYVADARAMELPLVGGGEHDWNYLLTVWDALPRDMRIAHDIRFVGAIIMGAAVWIGWRHGELPDAERLTSDALIPKP